MTNPVSGEAGCIHEDKQRTAEAPIEPGDTSLRAEVICALPILDRIAPDHTIAFHIARRLRAALSRNEAMPDLRALLTSLYNLPGVAEALVGAEDDFALAGEIADALGIERHPSRERATAAATGPCGPSCDCYDDGVMCVLGPGCSARQRASEQNARSRESSGSQIMTPDDRREPGGSRSPAGGPGPVSALSEPNAGRSLCTMCATPTSGLAWRPSLPAGAPVCSVGCVERLFRSWAYLDSLGTADSSGQARPHHEWCEKDGPVLWWRFPVVEPPYVGDPREDDFPGEYVTHWTPIVVPAEQFTSTTPKEKP